MCKFRPQFPILTLILVSSITLTGCATKKFVRYEISKIEPKIAENSNAIRETNEKLDAVDRRAQQSIAVGAGADQKATAAAREAAAAAEAASEAASRAAAADRKADTASQSAQQASARANALESRYASIAGTIDTYSVGEPQLIVFRTNSDILSDEAKQALDAVASGVAGQQGGYLIEIQGFTDTTGTENYNVNLSQKRADSALRYLVGKGVPVHRTFMVGLGEIAPVADNSSNEGRKQNRRVEVRVLKAAVSRGNN